MMNEQFGIDTTTIGIVLHEIIWAINMVFKGIISWLVGEHTQVVMEDFKRLISNLVG
jgi:hypothetical protein